MEETTVLSQRVKGNTGPKGVLADHREFVRRQHIESSSHARHFDAWSRRQGGLARSDDIDLSDADVNSDAEASDTRHSSQSPSDSEKSIDEDEEAFAKYREARMQALMIEQESRKRNILRSVNGEEFLEVVERAGTLQTVFVVVTKDDAKGCKEFIAGVSEYALELSTRSTAYVWLQIAADEPDLNFEIAGCPALLAYCDGELIFSEVRLGDILGWSSLQMPSTIQTFLVKAGLVPPASAPS